MKYALITGGSRGIGRAICVTLAKNTDYAILINYVSNKAAAEETLRLVEENGGKGEIIAFNVAHKEEVDKALEEWQKANPDAWVEVLVNNAGITKDGLFLMMEEDSWDKVVDISLKGFYNVTKAVLHKMIRKRYGRVVNMVSVSGVKGNAGQVNYSAAKGGIVAATKALAQEIAKRNITVNAVAPGFINTDMTEELDSEMLKKMIPANRFGEAQEVADLVDFLVSPKASYITGEIININGGIYS